mmetsp:Transcript_16430/g.42568  ORF Transcript_16430/g.42568 Transcript_16430/m.42568 type:complete len:188 (-) Transcript_16430:47-610(-)
MEAPGCMHQLDLLYEFMHTRNSSDTGSANWRRPFAAIGSMAMPWHEALGLAFAVIAAFAACVALCLVCRIVEQRPEILRTDGGIDKHDSIGGGALRRVEVFRGLHVAEINEGLPGSATKAVVTRDGAVYEWGETQLLRTRAQQSGSTGAEDGAGLSPGLASPSPKLLGPGVVSSSAQSRRLASSSQF